MAAFARSLGTLAEGDANLTLDARRYAATKAIVLSTVATAFPFFDIPVFWPILLVYFIVLFVITMRRQIGHMRKYKYVALSSPSLHITDLTSTAQVPPLRHRSQVDLRQRRRTRRPRNRIFGEPLGRLSLPPLGSPRI